MTTFTHKTLSVTISDATQYATIYQTVDGTEVIVGTLTRRRVLSPKGTPAWSISNTRGEVLVQSNYITHCLRVLSRSLTDAKSA